jgi:hypothetical protein
LKRRANLSTDRWGFSLCRFYSLSLDCHKGGKIRDKITVVVMLVLFFEQLFVLKTKKKQDLNTSFLENYIFENVFFVFFPTFFISKFNILPVIHGAAI